MNKYRYKASFRIRHPDFDPDIICSELGLVAKRKWKSGERRKTPRGDLLDGVNEETYCSFQLLSNPDVALIELIHSMNSKLETNLDFVKKIHSTGGRLEYYISLIFGESAGDIFPSELLSELANLNIDLALEFYGGEK